MIDDNTIFETAGGLVTAGMGWFMLMVRNDAKDAKKAVAELEKSTNEKISKLTDNLSDYKIYMASTIPTKIEMNAAIQETKETCKRIFEVIDRLDSKINGK